MQRLGIQSQQQNHGRVVEVCIDDQWHEATSAKVSTSQSSQVEDISVQVDSASVMIVWSEQSIPNEKTSVDMIYHAQHQHYQMARSMK